MIKKLYLIFIFVLFVSIVSAQLSIFGPKHPPDAPGILCVPTGCVLIGNIYGQNYSIFNVFLSGVTMENVTIVDVHHINATQVIGEYWVNETGDTMTGNLNMSYHNISDVDTIRARFYGAASPIYFVDENGTVVAQIKTTDYPDYGDDFGDLTVRTLTVDRLIINKLLNYSLFEPPNIYGSDEVWIYEDNLTFYFNTSYYNDTVQEQFALREENVTITVSGGSGSGVTTNCCSPSGEILQVAVFPTTSTNNYRFSANGTISGDAVDTDRIPHVGDWIVAHRGVVLFNENINLYITNANIDEQFTVRIRWRP